MRRPDAATWARALVSAGFVAWLVARLDWTEVGRTIGGARAGYVVLALALTPVLVGISACKWQILLRAQGEDPGFGTAFRLYLVGYFFNNFLPTNVGGDAVRAYLLPRRSAGAADAVASVVVERYSGFVVLVLCAAAAAAVTSGGPYTPPVRITIGALGAGIAALTWWLLGQPRAAPAAEWRSGRGVLRGLAKVRDAVRAYRDRPEALLWSLALSVVFYAAAAVNILVAVRAFGGELGLPAAVLAMPPALLIAAFPISLGGIGLAESGLLVTLATFGVDESVALSAALLIRLKVTLAGFLGALVLTSSRPGAA